MRMRDVLRTALQSLRGNLSRSLLTILGLGIGVGACIAIGSLGTAAVQSVREEMDRFGVDRIWIADAPGNASRLQEKDVQALEAQGGTVAALCRTSAVVYGGTRSKTCEVIAASHGYAAIEGLTLSAGRFLLAQDEENLLRTAVIEDILKEEIFGNQDAVGQKIRIGEHSYTVVGVLRTVKSAYFAVDSGTPKVYVPLGTHQLLTGGACYDEIVVRSSGADIPAMAQVARTTLKNTHGGQDSFIVTSLYEQIASADRVLSIVTTVLIVVGLICMITGGVGVMNVMLTGIRERRSEIGVRKALGARDGEIFAQFLCESALYGACGALLGVVLGVLMTHFGQGIVGVAAQTVPWVVLCAIAFACLVGAICGVYPAMRASRISPVAAMRRM